MSLALAVGAAALCGLGTYLALQRSLVRVIIGLGLIGHGVNLVLLGAGGRAGVAPVVREGSALGLVGALNPAGYADPMPQALALTAIVISFGTTAFLLTVAYRHFRLAGTDEVEDDIEDRRITRLELNEDSA